MKIIFYPSIIIGFLLLLSCEKKQELSDHQLVENYLIAYTRGTISSQEALKYIFKSSLPGEIEDWNKYFSISPKIEGDWDVLDGNQLVFVPKESFKNGENYTAHLKLSALNSNEFKKDLVLPFQIVKQYLNVDLEGIEVKGDENYQYVLNATSADKVDAEKLRACIFSDSKEIRISPLGDRQFKVIVEYDNDLSDKSKIEWSGKAINAEGEGSIKMFEVEDFKKFGVLFDQYIAASNQFKLYFSRRLDPNQNLSGMIQVEGKPINPEIRDNIIEFYLDDQSNKEEIKITCSKGIQAITGEKLASNLNFTIQTPMVKPAAEFVDKSNYIPSSQEVKIPIRTRNLKSIEIKIIEIPQENIRHYLAWNSIQHHNMDQIFRLGVPVYVEELALNPLGKNTGEWEHYGIDLTDKFKRTAGSLYAISLHFGPQNTRLICDESFRELDLSSSLDLELNKWEKSAKRGYYDYYSYGRNGYYYQWRERDDPCKISYYLRGNEEILQVQASDMGVIVKQGEDNVSIAAVDLVSLEPIQNAKVELFNFQGIEMFSGTTDHQGFSSFQKRDHAAVASIENNGQKVFLSLLQDNANDLSAFPISGTSGSKRDLFVYTNRGVWRPGDSIYLNLMVNGRTSNLPAGIPLVFEFYDHKGVLIDREKQFHEKGKYLYSFSTKTDLNAKTGNYQAKLKVGAELINKTIPIETVKPNDIEIKYTINNEQDRIIKDNSFKGKAKLSYLNGFVVKGAKVELNNSISKWNKPFPKWANYSFSLNKELPDNIPLNVSSLDGNGVLEVNSSMDLKKLMSRSRMRLEAKINLQGGGVNQEVQSFRIDPFEHYVGILKRKGRAWRGCLDFDKGQLDLPIVILNRDGELAQGNRNVRIILRKHRKSWWMDQYSLSRRSYYKSKSSWEELSNQTITVRNGKAAFQHLEEEFGRGVFEIVCEDIESGHQSSYHYNVYSDNARADATNSPDQLWVEQSKDESTVGEEVILKFPEFTKARALISIEQGDRIIETFWMKLSPNNRELSVYPDESWYPGVHIHISLLQPYGEQNNDRPTRMYSVQKLKVQQRKIALEPVLKLPESAEVQKAFDIAVSEKGGKPMQYTLAVVDEGLLNLSGFKTPDPKKHFEGHMALQVGTWDIYKLLMNKFKGNFAAILNIGGDDAYEADVLADFNRFKPVLKFFGPYTLNKGEVERHKVDLGNYAGKVRVMLVACTDKDFASKEEFIRVKSPLMLQTQFPRSLNLEDELSLPVTVFRENEKIKNVVLKVKSDESRVELVKPSVQMNFKDNQDLTKVPIKVKGIPGKLKFTLNVEGSGKKMEETTDIMVNFPNAYTSITETASLNEGEEWNKKIETLPFPDYAKHKIIVSGLKLPKITEYAEDLIRYPYGCLEQTVSAGFSQLFLDDILELTPIQKQDRERYVGATIAKLKSFQNSQGRFATWRSGSYYHSWSEIYTGYFMQEARNKGFQVPNEMWNSWLKKQRDVAEKWSVHEASSKWIQLNEEMIQAYRLFVLAKGGKPVMSAMNRLSKSMSPQQLTFMLLAGAYQLAGFDEKANQLLNTALVEKENSAFSYYTYGGSGRNLALIVDVISTFENKKELLEKYYFYMVEKLNNSYYANTQTKAHAFLACSRYLNKNKASFQNEIHFEVDIDGTKEVYRKSYWEPLRIILDKEFFDKDIEVNNLGKSDIVVDHIKRFVPRERIKRNESQEISMNVSLANTNLNTLGSPLKLNAAEEQMYRVTVTNTGPIEQKNLALNLKMPSGFELINPRVNKTVKFPDQASYEHQDYRDDRVYTFFSVGPNDSKTFYFKATAAFEGKFVQPAIVCEHMYNGDVKAIVKSNTVIIE